MGLAQSAHGVWYEKLKNFSTFFENAIDILEEVCYNSENGGYYFTKHNTTDDLRRYL
jgi:hypothetical protein